MCADDLLGLFQQPGAVGGEPGLPAVTFDDGAAEGLLQPPDVLADGGLAEGECARGAVETSLVGDGNETAQRHDVQYRSHVRRLATDRSEITIDFDGKSSLDGRLRPRAS
ncbi:hypothetical protein [Streptomyces rhizosphaericus]|uniref:hypothetical protein n=1 Tax=Streptomyces rhizosphaericus TaxID=114699 RepID=UPI002892B9B5|nr:hypothetical protein [Streptomyces rhizosphaericus]